MTERKPLNNTLFELQALKTWGNRYGWDAVEGLLDVRIGVYEKMEKRK